MEALPTSMYGLDHAIWRIPEMMINTANPVHVDYSMEKKTFFIQFAKHISVWKSNGVYDMKGKQLCRHVELSSLPCSPADPLRSQLAHR